MEQEKQKQEIRRKTKYVIGRLTTLLVFNSKRKKLKFFFNLRYLGIVLWHRRYLSEWTALLFRRSVGWISAGLHQHSHSCFYVSRDSRTYFTVSRLCKPCRILTLFRRIISEMLLYGDLPFTEFKHHLHCYYEPKFNDFHEIRYEDV
jgi:hypothetical protein